MMNKRPLANNILPNSTPLALQQIWQKMVDMDTRVKTLEDVENIPLLSVKTDDTDYLTLKDLKNFSHSKLSGLTIGNPHPQYMLVVTQHNDLGGLQGGTVTERYHITAEIYEGLMGAFVAVDGTTPLTNDWDYGVGRIIKGEKLAARSALGLKLTDKDGVVGLTIADGGDPSTTRQFTAPKIVLYNLEDETSLQMSSAYDYGNVFIKQTNDASKVVTFGVRASGVGADGPVNANEGFLRSEADDMVLWVCARGPLKLASYDALVLSFDNSKDGTFVGNAIFATSKYVGLGAAKGRLLFTDDTTDLITVKDANFDLDSNRITSLAPGINLTDGVNLEQLMTAASSFKLEEYFSAVDDALGGIYHVMDETVASAGTVVSGEVTAANQSLLKWITPVGHPGLTRILAGNYDIHGHLLKTGTKATTVYMKLYYCDADGANETLLGTSAVTTPLTTSDAFYDIYINVPTEVEIAADKRIVVELLCGTIGTGGATTVTMTVGGTANPHISIDVSSDVLTNLFLRLDGTNYATKVGIGRAATTGFMLDAYNASAGACALLQDTGGALQVASGGISRYDTDADGTVLHINYSGYAGGLTRYRNCNIDDGKGSPIIAFAGSTKRTTLYGILALNGNKISNDGGDEGLSVDNSGNVACSANLTVASGITEVQRVRTSSSAPTGWTGSSTSPQTLTYDLNLTMHSMYKMHVDATMICDTPHTSYAGATFDVVVSHDSLGVSSILASIKEMGGTGSDIVISAARTSSKTVRVTVVFTPDIAGNITNADFNVALLRMS